MEQVKTTVVNSAPQNWSEPEVLALRGAVEQIQQILPVATSGNTGFNFNWTAPNPASIISPMVRFRGTLNVVVNFTPNTAGFIPVIAPRAYPFSRLIQSFQVAINNQTIANSSYGEFATQLYKYKAAQLENVMPQGAVLQDYLTDYGVTAGSVSPLNVLGTANQCAGGRGGTAGFACTPATTTVGGAQAVATSIPFDEVLPLSVFNIDAETPWWHNVNTMSFNFQFTSQLANVIALANPNGVANTYSAVSVTAAAGGLLTDLSLVLTTATPNALVPKPARALYPVEFYDYQTSNGSTIIASGATAVLRSQNITCPAIPKAVYIYAQPAQASLSPLQSDMVLVTDTLTMTLDSKPVLNNMERNGLALISAKNGYRAPDRNFIAGTARITTMATLNANVQGFATAGVVAPGVFLLSGQDIPLPEGTVVGSGGSHTIQIEGTFRNQSGFSVDALLKVVLIYDQILEISQGAASLQYVNVSPSEAVKAGARAPREMLGAGMSGGGLVYGRKSYAHAAAGVLSGGGSGGAGSKSSLAQRLKA